MNGFPLLRRLLPATLLLPLAGCISLADYGEAPGQYQGMPDYPQEADGWFGRDVASVDAFYAPLGRYGHWDTHPGYGRVFVPGGVGNGWRPYRDGYWANDPRFGRRWMTAEPFGWATYHYGRWARDTRLGWFWVPDTRFGPGWVNWREGGGYSGWAPLPPYGWERWGVGYNPWGWDAWMFAPDAWLYRPGLNGHIVHGRPHYDRTRPAHRPQWHAGRPGDRPRDAGGIVDGGRPGNGWQHERHGDKDARPDRQGQPGNRDRAEWRERPGGQQAVREAPAEQRPLREVRAEPRPEREVRAEPRPVREAPVEARAEPAERRATLREAPSRQPD